jgi:5-methylthioadenosine/S-adenosylhomocysteine deaminase
MKTRIERGWVATMDNELRVYTDGTVILEDNRITYVGPSSEAPGDQAERTIDAQGKIVLPGLINTHVHLSQQLGRGIGDDVSLLTWLHERIWPYESSMTYEDSYISSLLCGIELIRTGVTCFAEAGGQHVAAMAEAMEELGLRGILARSIMDEGEGPAAMIEPTDQCIARQQDLIDRFHGSADGRLRVWPACRTIFNCSDALYLQTKELADRSGVGIHAHIAEIPDEVEFARQTRGDTTVAHLENLGVLAPNFLSVHTVWITERELDILAKRDVPVSHNPAAAMRVLGFADVPGMLERGILVALGTDGAPSNNRMNLISEMYLAGLIHKGRKLDPKVVPAEAVLGMVTNKAAKALLWDDEIGSLEVGTRADVTIINPRTAGMLPLHDPVANLVYAMDTTNVSTVIVDGRVLFEDGVVQTVDEQSVLAEAEARAAELIQRAGIRLPHRFPQT